MENSEKLLLLSQKDNVLVVCRGVKKGEVLHYGNEAYPIDKNITLGHKIAARDIEKGENIIKFNMSIGSAVSKIKKGEHVHIHNMKSDFIPTYTIEKQNNTL